MAKEPTGTVSSTVFDSDSESSPKRLHNQGPAINNLPKWRQQSASRLLESNAHQSKLINESRQREDTARLKLTQLKVRARRELARASSEAALIGLFERNRQTVLSVRAETDRLVGRDVTSRLAELPMPTEEQVMEISRLFNDALVRHYKPEDRSFYKIFKQMDMDGSQRISYTELENMARHHLHIPPKSLPQAKLDLLWKSLDEDLSGYIDAGELSRFTKLGKIKTMTPAQIARQKVQEEAHRAMEAVREESNKLLAKDVAAYALEVPRATPGEMAQLGALFARQLAKITGNPNNYHKLFMTMDKNGSGHVEFEEFRKAVRAKDGLGLPPHKLPDEKLWSLWHALDSNENGFICAGEWGRFMRGSTVVGASLASEQSVRVREAQERDRIARAEQRARESAQSACDVAKMMEAEARRLEALLETASQSLLSSHSKSLPDLALGSSSGGTQGKKSKSRGKADRALKLKQFAAEIERGGGASRRVGAPKSDQRDVQLPMLKVFAREEGGI